MYPNCMPDMILTQAVVYYSVFCSQDCFTIYKMSKLEKGGNSVNIYRILPKVNQIIYTLDTISEPNIMILAQAVLQIFCSEGSIALP